MLKSLFYIVNTYYLLTIGIRKRYLFSLVFCCISDILMSKAYCIFSVADDLTSVRDVCAGILGPVPGVEPVPGERSFQSRDLPGSRNGPPCGHLHR